MTRPAETLIEEGGSRYFGAMTASVSHEIKNCLAIMNENAGLMGDLIALSRQRPPLDAERIETIAQKITGQIQRADAILKNLNQFSHSMDRAVQSVDLFDAIKLAHAVGGRICANSRISVSIQPPKQAVQVTTPFFFLLYLIWTAMEGAVEGLPPGSSLEITPAEKDGRPVISFSSEHPIGAGIEKALGSPTGQNLLTLMSAEVAIDGGNQRIDLIFPLSSPAVV